MKSYQRLFLFALATLALTAILSPWAATAWAYITNTYPGWDKYRYTFSKIFDRVFMIAGVLLFFVCRRFLKLGWLKAVGLSPRSHAVRDLGMGAGLAVASMSVVVFLMSLTDAFDPFFRLSAAETLSRCGKALLAAVSVGFVEEVFFRGIIFKGLLQDMERARAYVLASLFFSAIHFVQPSEDAVLTGIHPWAGIRHLLYSFHPFLDPGTFPGLVGLFLIGTILCYAFERTGTLYLSVGLHAGWIFSLKIFGAFGHYAREDLGWMFGSTDPKIVSGVIPWLGMIVVGLLVHQFTRTRYRLFAEPIRE